MGKPSFRHTCPMSEDSSRSRHDLTNAQASDERKGSVSGRFFGSMKTLRSILADSNTAFATRISPVPPRPSRAGAAPPHGEAIVVDLFSLPERQIPDQLLLIPTLCHRAVTFVSRRDVADGNGNRRRVRFMFGFRSTVRAQIRLRYVRIFDVAQSVSAGNRLQYSHSCVTGRITEK